jgi:protein-disulfide isomerase
MADSKKKGSEKEVTVNMDTLGVPIAIIIAGVIIAATIFFASKNNDTNVNDNTLDNSGTEVVDETTDTPEDALVQLGDDPYLGNLETATVAVIDFSDYECGYCQRHSQEVYPSIVENYVDTGKVVYVFKEFPLSGVRQMGYTIAEGASCVFNLSGSETYEKFHKDAFFLESNSDIVSLGGELGVDEDALNSCLDDGTYRSEVGADLAEGQGAGISGTPGFIIGTIGENGVVKNAKLIAGAYPYETFVSTIDALLEE